MTVAAVVEHDGRFLFIEERVRGRLLLNQPAGHLELGESLIEALIRETWEESGWRVEPTGLIGIYQWTSPVDDIGFLRVAIAAKPISYDADRTLDQGVERAVWLHPDQLATHPVPHRSPMVALCLRDYLSAGADSLDRLRYVPMLTAS